MSYKDTLNLPQTTFPMRGQSLIDDPLLVERWEKEDLYEKAYSHNEGKEKFILHDGPPYANGDIHIGHAYNKILKDIITKSRRMMGYHVPVIPGWDCHGLPIELRVAQDNPGLLPRDLMRACRDYAGHWIKVQKSEFKRLGVLMNFNRPYTTMSPVYESAVIRAFGIFFEQGFITRKRKTVPWCFSCKTALASAEIEYYDRKDPSLYVLFPLTQESVHKIAPAFAGEALSLVIWTTTPWTLPLNRAVQYKPYTEYVIARVDARLVIFSRACSEKMAPILSKKVEVLGTLSSQLFEQELFVHHPFVPDYQVPLIPDPQVACDEGTAFVHCAPGAGPADYEFGIAHNLDVYAPIDDDGCYTEESNCPELIGFSVNDAQSWVIKRLQYTNNLLFVSSITHSYPHCWRCRRGLIFRATQQWFCDLSHEGLRHRALEKTSAVTFIPDGSRNRFSATLEGRLEWCLSRQRVWGSPIPALLCVRCHHPYVTKDLIDYVADKVAHEGIDYWYTVSVDQVLPAGYQCPVCTGTDFIKEQNILDVWFDSGVSHYAVLVRNHEQQFPADIYIEGKDQHRGWFQSSFLTSLVIEKNVPSHTIMTHGFTVDKKGRKMSKSLGNGVTPDELMAVLGTDGLRLWAAQCDMTGDAIVSDVVINNTQEVNRKIRNTCRFLLAALYDFDYEHDAVTWDDLTAADQYALFYLDTIHDELINAYKIYDFTKFCALLNNYCTVHLSSLYLDIIKDRLYVEDTKGKKRRSAQTACFIILDTLTRISAPIFSFMAEQLSDLYQKNKTDSIHLQDFASLTEIKKQYSAEYHSQWLLILSLRNALLKKIEELRHNGTIKHSLEARISYYIDRLSPWYNQWESFVARITHKNETVESFLKELLIVSYSDHEKSWHSSLQETDHGGFFVRVTRAQGVKCPRCWHYTLSSHHDNLCNRCQDVIK